MVSKINGILFFLLLSAGLCSFFFLKPEVVSMDEKRTLAAMPGFNWESYASGQWADSIGRYINDHFPARSNLVNMAGILRHSRGIHFENEEKVVVLEGTGNLQSDPDTEAELTDTAAIFEDFGDGASIDSIPLVEIDFNEHMWRSLLILNGRVYPLMGGSPKMGAAFGRMLNEYATRFNGGVRVFSAVPPLSCSFIPSEKYRKYNQQNHSTVEGIRNSLGPGAYYCDVFSALNSHTNEKLFYGTDHHWTANGAYHGYTAFCRAAGFEPVSRDRMEYRVKYNFLGSFYTLIRDKSIAEHPDTFEYYIPPVKSTAVEFGPNDYRPKKSNTFCHGSSGGNCYSTFICGDHPLMKITTGNKNGKKAMVIKNSMGNAFSVYLISHYEEVWVMDFRYSKHNLSDIIKRNKINDLIFAVGMHAAMSSGTIRMMRNLAVQKGAALPPLPATPSVSLDSVSHTKPVSASPDSAK